MAAVLDFGLIILRETGLKRSAFVGPEILGLFVSTLIADDKCSLDNKESFPQPIQMQLSKKKKFSLNLWSLHKFLYILKKR